MEIGKVAGLFVLAVMFAFTQVDAWVSRMNRGNELRLAGDLSAAEAEYHAALDLARSSGETGKRETYTLINLAGLYQDRGSYEKAEPMLLSAVGLLEKSGDPAQRDLALSLNNLGTLYGQTGRFIDAEAIYLRVIRIAEQIGGLAEDQLATGLAALGGLYVELGRTKEGQAVLLRALPLAQRALGANHRTTAHINLLLGDLQYANGDYSQAEMSWNSALSATDNSMSPRERLMAATLRMNLGELKRFERRYAQSESLLRSAVTVFESVGNGSHPLLPTALNHLALTYAEQERTVEAERMYRRALAMIESSPDMPVRVRRQHAVVLSNLARLRKQQAAAAEAGALFQRALASAEIGYGPAHPFVKTCLRDYSTMLREIGRKDEARDFEKRASRIAAEPPRPTVDMRDIRRAETNQSRR